MKKLSMVCLALLLAGGFAFAADGILQAGDGSVSFSMGIDGGTFGFDSEAAADVTGEVALDYAGELVSGGLVIGLIPDVKLTAGNSIDGSDVDADLDYSAFITDYDKVDFETVSVPYDELVAMYDYGIANGYFTAGAGNLVTDKLEGQDDDGNYIIKSLADIDKAYSDKSYLADIAQDARDLYDFYFHSTTGVFSDDLTTTDDDDAKQALLEEIFGEETDDSWGLSFPVSDAYLTLNNVGGYADVTFVLSEGSYSVGSMVSQVVAEDGKPLGMKVALSDGVIENLGAWMFMGAFSKSGDDLTTYVDESGPAVWSMEAGASYDVVVEDLLTATAAADFGMTNLANMNSWFLSIAPSVAMSDMFGIALDGEFNMFGRDDDGTALDSGMAGGASASATVAGITPSLSISLKNAEYGGDGSYKLAKLDGTAGADAVDGSSSASLFDTTDDEGAMRIAAGVSADLAEYVGYAVTAGFDFGYATDFAASAKTATDWAVNAGFAQDALSVAANYASSGDYGVSADYALEENATVSGGVNYVADDEKFVTSVGLTLAL